MQTAAARTYRFGNVAYDLYARTHLMGILNVTPDSFSDGGMFFDVESAVQHGLALAGEGADFIDVGGESTRPGAESISPEEEIRRTAPVIERLAKSVSIPISIDTWKHGVAEAALRAGAVIVNDISGLHFDAQLARTAARHQASMVLMHTKGKPTVMQANPEYEDVIEDISVYLEAGITRAQEAGIEQIIVDPGIGFGKKRDHNLTILKNLREFQKLGFPVLVGPSRKSFIGNVPMELRLEGTAAAVTACALNGAQIVRVHDVAEMKRVLAVADAIARA